MQKHDKWWTLDAINKLLYTGFDVDNVIDFNIGELKRAVNKYGPVKAKVSDVNDAGIHLCVKAKKMNLMTCVLLSSSKDAQPEEPMKGKAWKQASKASQAIVDSISKKVQIKAFPASSS
jgi:hypothetical protein